MLLNGKGVDWELFPFRGLVIVLCLLICGFTGIFGAVAMMNGRSVSTGVWSFFVAFVLFLSAVHLEARARQAQARIDDETKAQTHHQCGPDCR